MKTATHCYLALLFLVPLLATASELTISGHVVDPSGAVIRGAAVTLARTDGSWRTSLSTGAQGEFRFASLAPGVYRLTAISKGFGLQEREIRAESSSNIEITLSPAAIGETVTVTGDQGYQAAILSTATKTNTPLLQVPQSVQVVDQSVIQDQRDFEIADVLHNVSGVVKTNTTVTGVPGSEFIMRGFQLDANTNYLRDGARFSSYGLSDTADIEQIEIIKGPASALYGRGDAGGIVNLISKKPVARQLVTLEFTGGNYSFYRPQIDVSGSMNASQTLLYRLNAMYENTGSFRDFVSSERFFLAPYITWKPRADTAISVYGELLNSPGVSDYGVPAIGSRPAPVPISRFLGEPFNNVTYRERQGSYAISHSFSRNWSAQNTFHYYRTNPSYNLEVFPVALDTDNRTVLRQVDLFAFPYTYYYSQTDVMGTFNTGRIRHNVVIGFETGWDDDAAFGPGANYPSLDLFAPQYKLLTPAQARQLLNPGNPSFFIFNSTNKHQTNGGYLQDQIDLNRHWKLLAGVRFESDHQKFIDHLAGTSLPQNDFGVSPRFGLVYQPTEYLSLYTSYSRSFDPVTAGVLNKNNQPFNPIRAQQYEGGTKISAWQGKLISTLAVFHIEKTNVLTADPANLLFSVQTGKQRSKGVELDLTASPIGGLNVIAGYAFTQAQVIQDNIFPIGGFLPNAPRHSANLWMNYDVRGGPLRGFGLGTGVFATSQRQGDIVNDYVLPGYARVDAAVSYTWKRSERDSIKVSLNLKNVLDQRIYESSFGSSSATSIVRLGSPLTALANVRYSWH
jgi:iron complex outermembrane receptor protein